MDTSEKFWDKMAKKYSKSSIKDMKGYNKTLNETRKFLKRETTVLEIGCGTGMTALKLADCVDHMTATDISSNMIAIAKKRAADEKIENVDFIKCTLFDESLAKESFDAILAFNLLHLLEDTECVMKRVHELLKPGGVFISKTPCLKEKSLLLPIVVPIITTVMRAGPVKSFTVSEFQKSLTREGFDIIDASIQFPKPPRFFVAAKKCESEK